MLSTPIKPSGIKQVLDMTLEIREMGGNVVPLFAGHAGIGKTETARAWAKAKGPEFQYIDVRIVYMDRPDLMGLQTAVEVTLPNGTKAMTTVSALPEFLPRDGQGIIMWEEVNRAPESNMNVLMQILSERELHLYKLPEGFIQAALINPEGTHYSVNTMDTALKNRFTIYEVVYSFQEHLSFMKENGYNKRVISFIEGNLWLYKSPEELAEDEMFVSPRTFAKLNVIENYHDKHGGTDHPMFRENVLAALGSRVGADYYKFAQELKPVVFADFQKNKKAAMEKLASFCKKDESYKGDMVAITVNSLVDAFTEGAAQPELIFEVCEMIDLDQAIALLTNCSVSLSGKNGEDDVRAFLKKAKAYSPAMVDLMRRRASGSLSATGTDGAAAPATTETKTEETPITTEEK